MTPWKGRRRSPWLLLPFGIALLAVGGLAVYFRDRILPRPGPNELREQAVAAVKEERYRDAESLLGRIEAKRSLDWIMQSKVDQSLGHPEAALKALARIPDQDRMAPLARFSEGTILLHDLHRAPAAEAALRRAIELDPMSVQARQKLMLLAYLWSNKAEFDAQFRALERLGSLTYEDVYHACVTIRGIAETRQLVAMLRKFLEADPDDRPSRLALAAELRRVNQRDEAGKAIAGMPESDTAGRALRAELALDRGKVGEAEAILDAGPADDPWLAPVRGRLALARRDFESAIREYRLALTAQAGHRDALSGLGRALRLKGDAKEAEPFLKAAADLDALELQMQGQAAPGASSNPRALHELGAVCARLKRFPEARCWYRLALRYDPTAKDTREDLSRIEHLE